VQVAAHILYMIASILFIVAIKKMGQVTTARSANGLSAAAMGVAVAGALIDIGREGHIGWIYIGAGAVVGIGVGALLALRVTMEGMPELVALFNGLGGLASSLVAVALVLLTASVAGSAATRTATTSGTALSIDQITSVVLSILVGGVTLTGSLIAWAKLKGLMSGRQIFLPAHNAINGVLLVGCLGTGGFALIAPAIAPSVAVSATTLYTLLGVSVAASFILGVTFAIPVGGADMPVVVSFLNSLSGVAAAATGFILYNNLLIIAGSIVGAAGMILTIIMCRGMNRSLGNVLFAKFSDTSGGKAEEYKNVKAGEPVDLAIALSNASSAIIVPGYGMAAAQAQHAVRELGDLLAARGLSVRYGIHEVAGRMPGHMNVLLAEANVPYEDLYKREDIEADFKNTDVAVVIGANDVVNPIALTDKTSPLYGMPILPAHEAHQCFVIKRSLGAGFAGIKNELFESDRTLMVYGSAKDVIQRVIDELKAL
jgi:H+-translocating NAD(P) transhydrogenase subunit beta